MLSDADRTRLTAQLAAANDADAWAAFDRELRARPDRQDPDVYAMIKLGEAKSGPSVFATLGRMVRPANEMAAQIAGGADVEDMFVLEELQNRMMQPILNLMTRLSRAGRTSIQSDFGISELMRDIEFEMAMREAEADRALRMAHQGSASFAMFRDLIIAAESEEDLQTAAREIANELDAAGEGWRDGLTEDEASMLQRFIVDRGWDFMYLKIQRLERHLGYEQCVRMQQAFEGGPRGQRQVFELLETTLAQLEGRQPNFDNLPIVPGLAEGQDVNERLLHDEDGQIGGPDDQVRPRIR